MMVRNIFWIIGVLSVIFMVIEIKQCAEDVNSSIIDTEIESKILFENHKKMKMFEKDLLGPINLLSDDIAFEFREDMTFFIIKFKVNEIFDYKLDEKYKIIENKINPNELEYIFEIEPNKNGVLKISPIYIDENETIWNEVQVTIIDSNKNITYKTIVTDLK